MYATAPTTEIFISRPRKTVHETTLAISPGNGTAARTPLRPTNTDIDAWARHASAANGFGEAAIGLEPRPGAHSRHES
jgi:hypothetical protein